MKKFDLIAAALFVSSMAAADTVLFYDSISGGSALGIISSKTDASFVTSSSGTTTLGTNATFVQEHSGGGTSTVTYGTGVDMQFRFGANPEALSGTLLDAASDDGEWIGISFIAAQDLTIDSFSFDMYVNNQSGSLYSARDAGLFVRIGNSDPFTAFGAPFDGTGTGDQGTIPFAGAFNVLSGQEVQFRLAFTDRTSVSGGAQQEATRLGSFNISAVAGASPSHYFDTNGANVGFGEASGSYPGNGVYWSTTSNGTATPDAWANGRNLNFGFVGTDGISGNTFTVDLTGIPGNAIIGGLNVNQPAAVVIAGDVTKNVFPTGNQTWSVASGAALDISLNWDSNGTVPGGLNHGDNEITLMGEGTINFNSAVLMNGKDGHFDQNAAGLTVNLAAAAMWDATPLQGNYIFSNGILNFSTAASSSAFAKMDASKTVTINGGALDNTSGAPLILDIGSGSYRVGGNFAFTGSDNLDLGDRSVDLEGGTRTITVAANTLEIGGVITDGGLVKEGSGTVVLSGNNTYTGSTSVNSGTLRLGASQLPMGLKVMPLGDSITYGFGGASGQSGYRKFLYDYLHPVMPSYQYVGVKTGIPNGTNLLPGSPIDQRNHQGMPSYAIEEVNNNLDGLDNSVFNAVGGAQRDPEGGYWLEGGNGTGRDPIHPDIILIMLGTNDWQIMTGVRARLNALLTKLVTMRPNAHIIVANIVPNNNAARNDVAITLNGYVDAEIALFRQDGKHVSGVDLHTGYPAGQFVDGTHPNTTGYQWMAKQWNNAVNAVAKGLPDNNLEPSNFSLVGSSLVSVSSGATLDLDGHQTTVANLAVAGDLLLEGGDLTVGGDLLLESSANVAMGIGSTSDQVTVTGNLTLDGTLNLDDAGGFATGSYTLFTYSGGLTDHGLVIGTLPDGELVYELDTATPGEVKLVVSTPFSAWQALYFGEDADNPLIAGPLVDADFDGVANLLEYYAGTDPTDPEDSATPQVTGFVGTTVIVSYQRVLGLSDVTGVMEWSSDLTDWYQSGASDGVRVIDVAETILSAPEVSPERVEATFETTSGPAPTALFIRQRVELSE